MIGHGQRSSRAIGILAYHGNVFALPDDLETQSAQGRHNFGFRRTNRKFKQGGGSDGGFCDEGIQRRAF